MKGTFRSNKGISELIAYVLLITLSITISIIVYGWLRLWVAPGNEAVCPEGVSVTIPEYSCDSGLLELKIKNKGRYNVDGFYVRVHNTTDASFGLYTLYSSLGNNFVLHPGEETPSRVYGSFGATGSNPIEDLGEITLIEVQPFVEIDSKSVLCENYASIKVNDCSFS